MRKILFTVRYEFVSTVFRRSFILMLVILPLASFAVLMVVKLLNSGSPAQVGPINNFFSASPKPSQEGFIDPGGIIRVLPTEAKGRLLPYATEELARRALQSGQITGFYVLSANYLQSGQIVYVRKDFNPLGGMSQSDTFQQALNYNLLKQDATLAARLQYPLQLDTVLLSGAPQRNSNDLLTFFLPYIVTFLFYIVIFGSASLTLNSITREKENRVLEILMTSITPLQLLTGKIIGLGLAGLLQTIIWESAGLGLLRLSGQMFQLPASFQLPVSILAWGVVFFILGYALYASLMAGVGALVPNLRESSQVTLIIAMPLFLPLIMIGLLSDQPNGAAAMIISMFPLTAPVAMMTRLAAADVPVWQPLLAAVLLLGAAALTIRSVARLFRAQTMLSGQLFNLKVYFRAIFGKA
ncbi:MAG: ABC transporter permease [Anaerolineaceae bacterium]|nr:ABC transporter permease [Anaerolineaceae bacterium]